MKTDIIKAHKHSSNHKHELRESKLCGCFYCCKTFPYKSINDWVDDGEGEGEGEENQTACCPYCGIDSIIGSKSGYPIEKDFLKRMEKHWF